MDFIIYGVSKCSLVFTWYYYHYVKNVMCNPYASVSVSLREMFIGIHMVALSLDCLMLSPSLAAAIDGWSRCSPVGVVLIRAVLSGSRAAVVMTLVAWWLWRPGLSGRGRMFELRRVWSSVVWIYLWCRRFRPCCGTQFRFRFMFRRFWLRCETLCFTEVSAR